MRSAAAVAALGGIWAVPRPRGAGGAEAAVRGSWARCRGVTKAPHTSRTARARVPQIDTASPGSGLVPPYKPHTETLTENRPAGPRNSAGFSGVPRVFGKQLVSVWMMERRRAMNIPLFRVWRLAAVFVFSLLPALGWAQQKASPDTASNFGVFDRQDAKWVFDFQTMNTEAPTNLTSTYGCDAKDAVHLTIAAPASGVLVQLQRPVNRIDICVPAGTIITTTMTRAVP